MKNAGKLVLLSVAIVCGSSAPTFAAPERDERSAGRERARAERIGRVEAARAEHLRRVDDNARVERIARAERVERIERARAERAGRVEVARAAWITRSSRAATAPEPPPQTEARRLEPLLVVARRPASPTPAELPRLFPAVAWPTGASDECALAREIAGAAARMYSGRGQEALLSAGGPAAFQERVAGIVDFRLALLNRWMPLARDGAFKSSLAGLDAQIAPQPLLNGEGYDWVRINDSLIRFHADFARRAEDLRDRACGMPAAAAPGPETISQPTNPEPPQLLQVPMGL